MAVRIYDRVWIGVCVRTESVCVCVSVRSRPFRCVRAYVSKQYMRLFVVSPNSSGGTCRMKRCLLFVVRSFALYACVCVCVCVFTHKQSSTSSTLLASRMCALIGTYLCRECEAYALVRVWVFARMGRLVYAFL